MHMQERAQLQQQQQITHGQAVAQQQRNTSVQHVQHHTTTVGQAQVLRQHNTSVQHVHNFGLTPGQAVAQQQRNTNVQHVHNFGIIHGLTLQAMLQKQTISAQCAHKNGIMIGILGAHGQHQVTIKHTAEQEHVQHVHM